MTLLGLIAVVLFGGLRFGASVWQAGESQADRLAEMQAVQGFLRRQLSAADPIRESRDLRNRNVSFTGEPDSVRFLALMPPYLGVPGYYLIEFREDSGPGGRRSLSMSRRLVQPGAGEGEKSGETQERLLLDGIAGVEFSYFGADAPDEPPSWRDFWRDAPQLPALVRVRIVFPDDDRRTWPDLVVATHLRAQGRRR